MIEVKGLTKRYGNFHAVDDISFEVKKGEILGFLGPNGAGKSTTMKMITGFIEPTMGTAVVDGHDIKKKPIEVAKSLGYLPESAPSYAEMTAAEFLSFISEVRGKTGSEKSEVCERVRKMCFLEDVWDQPIETLSKGYKQRVGFAQALIHDPPIFILDEPTDGLDPNQKHEVRQLIKKMGESGKTIVLSTHILEEVEAVCDRVIIIAEGRLIEDSTPIKLAEKSRLHNAVTLTFDSNDTDQAVSALAALEDVDHVEPLEKVPESIRVFSKERKPILSSVSELVKKEAWNLKQIHVEHGKLDEVFRQVTLNDQKNN